MQNHLDTVLSTIGDAFKEDIKDDSRHYIEVDIGKQASELGYTDIAKAYGRVFAVVPLRRPVGGMRVRIDGRTFVNYSQLQSGVAVPGYVAQNTGLPRRHYQPNDSMILNFD